MSTSTKAEAATQRYILSCQQSGVCRPANTPSGYGLPTEAEARADAQRMADTTGQDVALLDGRSVRVATFRMGHPPVEGAAAPVPAHYVRVRA